MASQGTGFQIAAAVGIFATGIASGLTFANPARIDSLFMCSLPSGSPTTTKVTLAPSVRLAIWDAQYATGARSMPPFAASACIALVTAGKLVGAGSKSGRWIGTRAWYWTAAGLALSIIPFTLAFIKPVNDALFAMRRSVSIDVSTTEQNLMEARFKKWVRLHYVRIAASMSAFGMAISAAVL